MQVKTFFAVHVHLISLKKTNGEGRAKNAVKNSAVGCSLPGSQLSHRRLHLFQCRGRDKITVAPPQRLLRRTEIDCVHPKRQQSNYL